MLLYLTSSDNIGLFDFLADESGMLVKKLTGEFSLKRFVIHDMRNLSHFLFLAIDLKAIVDEQEDILEALIAFKTMYDSRIILFAESADENLIEKIMEEAEVYNIITATKIEKIQEEIKICVSPNGMTKKYLKRAIYYDGEDDYSKYSFIAENVKIMVAGAMTRVGTTTTAIDLACYLSSIGAKVSYTEANNSGHLTQIHSYFFPSILINDNFFSHGNVDYFLNSSIPVDYNFNIIDIGVLNEKNTKVFDIGDVKLLCAGSKPYEIKELKKSLKTIDSTEKLNIILPENLTDIKKSIPLAQGNLLFSKLSNNLFDSSINTNIWRTMLLSEYIVESKRL